MFSKKRLTNISEMDLFSQALAFLSLNTKQEDLFEPLSEKGKTRLLLHQTTCTFLTSYLKERSHITKFSPIFYLKISARYSASYCYCPQRSCEGYVFTRVCDSVHRGVCYPSMHCRWHPSMPCSRSPGRVCSGGVCSGGCLLQEGGLVVVSQSALRQTPKLRLRAVMMQRSQCSVTVVAGCSTNLGQYVVLQLFLVFKACRNYWMDSILSLNETVQHW